MHDTLIPTSKGKPKFTSSFSSFSLIRIYCLETSVDRISNPHHFNYHHKHHSVSHQLQRLLSHRKYCIYFRKSVLTTLIILLHAQLYVWKCMWTLRTPKTWDEKQFKTWLQMHAQVMVWNNGSKSGKITNFVFYTTALPYFCLWKLMFRQRCAKRRVYKDKDYV